MKARANVGSLNWVLLCFCAGCWALLGWFFYMLKLGFISACHPYKGFYGLGWKCGTDLGKCGILKDYSREMGSLSAPAGYVLCLALCRVCDSKEYWTMNAVTPCLSQARIPQRLSVLSSVPRSERGTPLLVGFAARLPHAFAFFSASRPLPVHANLLLEVAAPGAQILIPVPKICCKVAIES